MKLCLEVKVIGQVRFVDKILSMLKQTRMTCMMNEMSENSEVLMCLVL